MFARRRFAPLACLVLASTACAGGSLTAAPQLALAYMEPASTEHRPAPLLEVPPAPTRETVALAAPQPNSVPAAATGPSAPLPWMQSLRPTPLRAGPGDDSAQFTTLPPNSFLHVMEQKMGWLLVVYGGDGETRLPGTAWVRATDVATPAEPPRWVKNFKASRLWSGSDRAAASYTDLPQWSVLELMGKQAGDRLQVRYPGDGRYRQPGVAWVDAADVGPVQTPRPVDLPRAYPLTTSAETLRLRVPYQSQLDGTPWEAANCGPTTLSMALEGVGSSVSSAQLRREALDLQELWGDDVGVYMDALAIVADRHNARVLDLLQNGELRRWTLDDVRRHVREGRPVVLQVLFRALPGRQDSEYYGDHYIVITGLAGEAFLYNDAVDSDGLGYDRVLSGAELLRAMSVSDTQYAHAGFALAKR